MKQDKIIEVMSRQFKGYTHHEAIKELGTWSAKDLKSLMVDLDMPIQLKDGNLYIAKLAAGYYYDLISYEKYLKLLPF